VQSGYRDKISRWERIRLALEELGPTFIKFGQFLSNRPDLLPKGLIDELIRLQDNVQPFSFSDAREIVEKELGDTLEQLFMEFDEKPLASASIAQVHKAVLKSGYRVAVKVRRARIRNIINTDLDILYHAVSLVERRYERARSLRLKQFVEEFERTIEKELDFTIEASHIERFDHNFRNDKTVKIPAVYMELTTPKVLITELIEGIKVSEIEKLKEAGIDTRMVAKNGTRIIMKQIFDHGFFHADPHPGNILILEDGTICFLDFGAVGFIPASFRYHLSVILYGVVNKDPQRIIRTLSQLNQQPISNSAQLDYELTEFIEHYSFSLLKQINMGDILQRFINLIVDHDLRIMPGFFLLFKTIITIEGVGYLLDPDFKIIQHVEPHVKKLVRENPHFRHIPSDIYFTLLDLVSLLKDLPFETKDLVRMVKTGELRIQFDHRGLEPVILKSDQIVNRIVFSVVLASLIIGSSLIVHADIPPKIFDIPLIGIAGYVIAGLIGFGLIFMMIRQKKW
jgi:ubiquinone biosynthesis protein